MSMTHPEQTVENHTPVETQPLDEVAERSMEVMSLLTVPLQQAVDKMGFSRSLTSTQIDGVPVIITGEDTTINAPTGTGKTLTFVLGGLNALEVDNRRPQILVITPTRELAAQVAKTFQACTSELPGVEVATVYGGQSYQLQIQALKRGAQVVVGTPGRLSDLVEKKILSLQSLRLCVLDEADEMLQMGFLENIEWLLSMMPEDRQMVLCSATMPKDVLKISKQYMQNPRVVTTVAKEGEDKQLTQCYIEVSGGQKMDVLLRLLDFEEWETVILFVRTKRDAAVVAEKLQYRGYQADALHGDLSQAMRERILQRFHRRHLTILVATDVAARGIDVPHISHVINYDAPQDFAAYTHRIGRTARAGKSGTTILLADHKDRWLIRQSDAERMMVPSAEATRQKRAQKLVKTIRDTLAKHERQIELYKDMFQQVDCGDLSEQDMMAALALLAHDHPLPTHDFVAKAPSGGSAPKRRREFSKSSRSSDRPFKRKFSDRREGPRGGRRDDQGGGFERPRPKFERGERPKFERSDRPKFERGERPRFDRKNTERSDFRRPKGRDSREGDQREQGPQPLYQRRQSQATFYDKPAKPGFKQKRFAKR